MMRDKGEEFANTVGLLLMRSVHKWQIKIKP
jgi:hypothetical protein